jgi:molybdopterin-binding protein
VGSAAAGSTAHVAITKTCEAPQALRSPVKESLSMAIRFSARNQLKATVKSVKLGTVMAEVIVELADGQQIVSAITRASAEGLGLKEGDEVFAIIKATEVMVGKSE